MQKIIAPLSLISVAAANLSAQRAMSLTEAVSIGLDNNHQVKVSRNEADISNNNQAIGTGGFLPTVTAHAVYTEVRNSTRQERYDGTVNEKDNARSTTSSANVQAVWVLFDGMAMFVDRQRYKALGQLGEVRLKEAVENTVAEITTVYYAVVQQQNGIAVAEEALAYSKQRRQLAGHKFRLGSASETEVLQAAIDVNADSAVVLDRQWALSNTKADLCLLMGLDTGTDIRATDTIAQNRAIEFASLMNTALQHNANLQQWEINERVAALQRKLANAPKYPRLSFNAMYAFSLSEAEVGLLSSNRNYGPSLGLSLSYPLFDGFKSATQAKNARVLHENAMIEQDFALESLKAELLKRHNDYNNQLMQAQVAQANAKLARRNAKLAWERYRLGEISDLDFRQSQYIQSDAENRWLTAQWHAKQLETELLRLSGILVGEP